MQFIDANIFIRFFTKDDPIKAQSCFNLFKKAKQNKIAITTSEAIIAEVVYVLSSKNLYNKSSSEIRSLLYPIISLPGLKLSNRKKYLRALDIYALYSIDFEDAMAIAYMESKKVMQIYSYDKHFDRIKGIERLEP